MSLFHLLSVSGSGLEAQRKRAELLTENLANAETTRTPEGGPYRRKDVVFEAADVTSSFSDLFQASTGANGQRMQGVLVSDVIVDEREPEKRYLPGHPDADAQGYVAFPRLNPAEEMVDLLNASRGYQANVTAMTSTKDMISKTLDIMRG